jgi:phosphatidate phosphatase APP1
MDDFLNKLAHTVGRNLRGAKRSFDRRIGKTEHPHIVPYRGYGNDARVMVMGRALRDPGLREVGENDTLLQNLIESYKRIETDELPGARIRVTYQALAQEIVADRDGFFRATIELGTPPAPDTGYWHEVKLELVDPVPASGELVTAAAQTLVPPKTADFIVISDLDDTVIQTGATDVVRMVRATLFGNARTRIPFAGVAAFYAALQQGGGTATSFNPIFYVSSSPWNLYDVIEQFLALQRIPMGPTLLRDWGMSLDRIPLKHSAHKLTAIRQIMDMYPEQRVILIGDSGQEDPEIYREIVREYPQRVLCCYIRNVTPVARAESLKTVAGEVAEAGSTMVIVEDTKAAAAHAAQNGWISEESRPDIAKEEAQVEQLPKS